MEAPCLQSAEEAVPVAQGEDVSRTGPDQDKPEASSSTEEGSDEDSEPEAPVTVRRKVSFADAFGLSLVSVKEFDNADATESGVSWSDGGDEAHSQEEYHLTCLFTLPSDAEELDQRLGSQMLELESVELIRGTTVLRGIIRVANLCFSKKVYARMTVDGWSSFFDLPAEYVPGSSDMKTDKFAFTYHLAPPFQEGGSRIEFCLRYETPAGTYWANNRNMNYVLLCHQRVKENVTPPQDESKRRKSTRSCLKAQRQGSGEENTEESLDSSGLAAELELKEARKADREAVEKARLLIEENKLLVESIKSRRRAARLARMQDFFSQRRQQLRRARYSGSGREPSLWSDSPSSLYRRPKTSESPQVLTYHQIPLLTLDWNSDTPPQWGTAEVDDIWAGAAKMTVSGASETDRASVNDTWETFPTTAGDTDTKETSVSDVWQVFLNRPRSTDRSDVPEAEWLQTAASVSPSNDKRPRLRDSAGSQEFEEFRMGANAPTDFHSHISAAACQPPSDGGEALSATVASDTEAHQPARDSRDDSAGVRRALERSKTGSVTGTPREFSLQRAAPVSEHSAGSTGERHEPSTRESGAEGIIGRAGRKVGGVQLHAADLVTSSGEQRKTTDMTGVPESPNASANDRISRGASRDEGLSSGEGREVRGSGENAAGDTLAFRETIRQGTKDPVRHACTASRQGPEEGNVTNSTGRKAPPVTEVFKQRQIDECHTLPTCTDVKTTSHHRSENQPQEPNESDLIPRTPQSLDQDKTTSGEMNQEATTTVDKVSNIQSHQPVSKGKLGTAALNKTNSRPVGREEERKDYKTSVRYGPTMQSVQLDKLFQVNHEKHHPGCRGETKKKEGDVSHETRSEATAKEDVGHFTLIERRLQCERVESDELKMESASRLRGHVENSREETMKNPSVDDEPSVEVESPPSVRHRDGAKHPNELSQVVEMRTEPTLVERFGDDLVKSVFKEIFTQLDTKEKVTDTTHNGRQREPPKSATKGPMLPWRLGQRPTPAPWRNCSMVTPGGRGWNKPERESLCTSRDQEVFSKMKERSCHKEVTRDPAGDASSQHFSKTSNRSNAFLCWSVLYAIGHIARLFVCSLLVGGFFVVLFLYDFPAFFAFYVFSMCWWILKLKRQRVAVDKDVNG